MTTQVTELDEIGSKLVTDALAKHEAYLADDCSGRLETARRTFKLGLFNHARSVSEFHVLINAAPPKRMDGPVKPVDENQDDHLLKVAGEVIDKWAEMMLTRFKLKGDTRHLRAHLMMGELAEVLQAMQTGDEVLCLDGLADLLYVVHGSAISMDLPLDIAFMEVHRSNMTKRPQPTDPDAARVRDKGPDYQPPRIAELLAEYRQDEATN